MKAIFNPFKKHFILQSKYSSANVSHNIRGSKVKMFDLR